MPIRANRNHDLQHENDELRQRVAQLEQQLSLEADYIELFKLRLNDEGGDVMIVPWEIIERAETEHVDGRLIDLGVETLGGQRFRVQHFVRGADVVGQRGVTRTSPWP